METFSTEQVILFFLIICSVLLGIILLVISMRIIGRFRVMGRIRKGQTGEVNAKLYLLKSGYRIIAEQPLTKGVLLIDGNAHQYQVRVDYLVEKDGIHYLVEVKTGKRYTNPIDPSTRRQLLEYSVLYDINSLLLFDGDKKKLSRIEFPPANANPQ